MAFVSEILGPDRKSRNKLLCLLFHLGNIFRTHTICQDYKDIEINKV